MQYDKKKEPEIKKEDIIMVCIDDFALKKRQSYGSVIVDIKNHRIVDIIDSREYEDVKKWLETYPNLILVSRDGSITYHNAIKDSHPAAVQVSDRFHLFKNLTSYAKNFLKKELGQKVPISLPVYKTSLDNTDKDCIPANKADENRCLTREEKLNKILELQSAGLNKSNSCKEVNMDIRCYSKLAKMTDEERKKLFITKSEQKHKDAITRKQKLVQEVQDLKNDGLSNSAISKKTGMSTKTIKKYLKDDFNPIHASYGKKKSGNLVPYMDIINSLLKKGAMGSNIEAIIRQEGYTGSSSNIRHYITSIKKRKDIVPSKSVISNSVEYIERKDILKLLFNTIDKVKAITQNQFERLISEYPLFAKVYGLILDFHSLFEEKDINKLDLWIENAKKSGIDELKSFVNGLERDMEAVRNAVCLDYNNGLAEGSVNKIKVIKRIMYGRCSFNMLRKKILQLEEFRKTN